MPPTTTAPIPGGELAVSTWDLLAGAVAPAETVLVYDISGRHEAASCINLLTDRGSTVELVTPDRMALAETGGQTFPIYLRRFHRQGVAITPDSRVAAIATRRQPLCRQRSRTIYGGDPASAPSTRS